MPKLENTLIDTCVVVGINKDVVLVPSPNVKQEDSVEKYGPYRQSLLAVFNESVAYFPESCVKIDGEPFYGESQVVCPSIESADSDRRNLPFAMEIVENLPTFCFPSGGYLYTQNTMLQPEITYLVLTNIDGERTYAVCITILRPFVAIKNTDDEGKVQLSNATLQNSPAFTQDGKLMAMFAPMCFCLVSSFPYFNTMKDCLSSLLPQTNNGGEDIEDLWRTLMKMATTLTLIPVPPAGPLAVRFNLYGSQHTIYPAAEADRRVIDIDIHLPLLIFTPELIVKIITCLLTQQRMVFMASSYPLLTITIESFFTYIDPIKYVDTYVPTLPNCLGDFLEAPGQFIMGVHSSLKSQVRQIRRQPETPNIVLVDIDKGDIDLGDECNLPAMPDIIAQSLIVRLKKVAPHFDLKLVSVPTVFTYKEMIEQREELLTHVRSEIQSTFLDMLVSLFSGIFNHMSVSEQYFNREAFLQSHSDDEQAFYSEVVSTDGFRRFVQNRLEKHELRDEFAVLGERVAQKRRTGEDRRHTTVTQRHNASFTHWSTIPKHEFFLVPMLLEESLSSGSYYNSYCNNLTHQLKTIDQRNKCLKASYMYLRGFAHIACDKPIEGLRDFHSLYSSAPELFPKEFATEIVNNLDPIALNQLQSEPFYKETFTLRTFTNRIDNQLKNALKKLTDTPVDKTEFEKRMRPSKIAISTELVDWLFEMLATEEESVPHQRYNEFCKIYADIEKRTEVNEVAGVKLQIREQVLKVSSLISSEKGMGRLVLTVNRLYFIRDCACEATLVTPVCDIKEIIKYQQHSVFWTGVQALKIINMDSNIPAFYACLKEECDTWFLFLDELSTGHKSSIILRENNMVNIAVNNVMVAQTLLEMKFSLKEVEGACYFIKRKACESEGLSDDTKEALEIRLDPCVREKNRTTVWSIAYVPGNPALNESASVWCGMGSGAIVVYETEKWNCVSELRYAKSRISRLFLVGSNQMWAGSIDTVIYIINTETRKSEQQLQNHTDFVSDIISQTRIEKNGETKTLVWTSSYNGQIVCWDSESREAVCSTTLPKVRTLSQIILVRETTLWCITNDEIILVDTANWCILRKLVIHDDNKFPVLLGCALKVSEEYIWIGSKFGTTSPSVGALHIWNTTTCTSKPAELVAEIQISSMVSAYGSVWVGNKDGKILIMTTDGKTVEREFHVHEDMVKSMCETPDGYVITGSSSKEGKVCVWNATSSFDVIDGRRQKTIKDYEFVDKDVPLFTDILANHFRV